MSRQSIPRLLDRIGGEDIARSLAIVAEEFPGAVTFSTSFGIEDQVITHLILTNDIPISIFTLDTGRLFPETYALWSRTRERYGARITACLPDSEALGTYLDEHGPNALYESVELRKECCHIRKVEPLRRALRGNAVWVTGIRAEHSESRGSLAPLEWDEANRIIKFHPLLHWSAEEVRQYAQLHDVPCNPLHDRGFVSIGCAPCTRAIRPGEDFRAGRWWWERSEGKECGLHG